MRAEGFNFLISSKENLKNLRSDVRLFALDNLRRKLKMLGSWGEASMSNLFEIWQSSKPGRKQRNHITRNL
jgi:hypothetical protein